MAVEPTLHARASIEGNHAHLTICAVGTCNPGRADANCGEGADRRSRWTDENINAARHLFVGGGCVRRAGARQGRPLSQSIRLVHGALLVEPPVSTGYVLSGMRDDDQPVLR